MNSPPSKVKIDRKKFIESQIQSGLFTLDTKKGMRYTAKYWETFRSIFDANKNEIKDFVCCDVCKHILKYDTAGSGTKNIKDHFAACKPGGALGRFVQRNKTNFTKSEKNRIAEAAVRFCAKDLRPFYAISGEGLMDFLVAIASICGEYGCLSRESLLALLPCPNTVSTICLSI